MEGELELFDTKHYAVGTKTTKPRKKSCCQAFIHIVYDFAENTTINGLKYIIGQGVFLIGRLFWTVMFIVSIVLCSWMLYKSYTKWERNTIIITLKEHLLSVSEVPFPAVTICPQARIRQEYYNFTEIYMKYETENNDDDLSDIQFHSTAVLCDLEFNTTDYNNLTDLYTDLDTIIKVAPKREDVFEHCLWRNKHNCTDAFRPVLTKDGVCFTFNSVAADEMFRKNSVQRQNLYMNTSRPRKGWSLDSNYENADGNEYPARGRGNGANEDLYIVLKEIQDRDFGCEQHTRPGYKVYLHHPADLPQASLHYYTAHPEQTTSFALKLEVLVTSDEIIDYSPDVRQCYFPSERRLQFFQYYTSKNCQLECLANYTLQRCKCVSYYMPRNNNMDICKADKLGCIKVALDHYAAQEGLSESKTSQCGCLPSCYDIKYDADIIVTKFDQKAYEKKAKVLVCSALNSFLNKHEEEIFNTIDIDTEDTDNDDDNLEPFVRLNSALTECTQNTSAVTPPTNPMLTEIRMYYRHPQYVAMERSELFGLSQFLADCGGTLGLFLGFSFLTLAEIVYFFTLKLCCDCRKETSK